MSEPTQEEVISVVSSIFDVSDMELTLELLKFKIDDKEFKSKFVYLAQKLEERDLVCRLQKKYDDVYILVSRFPPRKQRKWLSTSWTPRLLFSVVIVFVMIDGYFRTEATNSIVNIGDPLEMAGIYTLSLLGILGIHESGHLVAAKLHKLKTSWPYFIPGIPVYGIPTFGAVITSRGLTVNRHILFDVAIAGPIAGLVIAIIVAIYGAATAPVLDEQLAQELFAESRLLEFNEPILMQATLSMFGKGGEQQVIMTPVLFAAWLGFFITFVNLLPAWQLDGGHMARALFGQKWHRIGTYASIGVLFWPLKLYLMAMFILLLSSRNPSAIPLDDVSPLPTNRKIMYVVVIILAILCAPLPGGVLF